MSAWRRFRNLLGRERMRAEIRAEIEAHLAMRIEENMARGMSPEEARRAALVQFGPTEATQQQVAEADAWLDLDRLWFDLRYAVRQLRKSPGYTLTALLSLAVGIGINTAVFSSMDAVVLHPLAVPDLSRVVTILERTGASDANVPLADFADWARQSRSFAELDVRGEAHKTLTGGGDAADVDVALVRASFFRVLGVQPVAGRLIADDECAEGRDAVAVLSFGFWKRRFGGDTGAIGRTLELDRRTYTIVGILPKSVAYPSEADLFLPLAPTAAEWADRRQHSYMVMGRLRDGVSVKQAGDEIGRFAAGLAETYPATNRGWGTRLEPLLDSLCDDLTPLYYRMVMAATLFVLLVVCANVANLAFARGIARRPEIAMRAALGAGRWRIARQLLLENFVLALGGAVAGLGIAWVYLRVSNLLMPERVARYLAGWENIRLSGRTFVFSLAMAAVAAIVSGLAPVADALRVNLSDQLKAGSRSTTGNARGRRLRNLFAMAQMALAVALVIGAALVAKGMWGMLHRGDRYQPQQVLTFDVALPKSRYPTAQLQEDWYRQALDRLRALPGVRRVEMATALPLSDMAWGEKFVVEGRPATPGRPQFALRQTVSPGYFAQWAIPIVEGRGFTQGDSLDSTPVAIVSQRFAARYLGGENPIGKVIRMGDTDTKEPWVRIVGVVGEVEYGLWDTSSSAAVYLDARQQPEPGAKFALTVEGDSLAVAPAARRALAGLDPALPLTTVESYDRLLKDNLTGLMFAAGMMAIDALVALLLAALGIFGAMAAMAGEQTREIGVRLALGARREDVLGMMLKRGGWLTGLGLVAGLGLAFALARVVAGLLRGVRPDDPVVFLGIAAAVALVGLAASWTPARRAARVDPIQALRSE